MGWERDLIAVCYGGRVGGQGRQMDEIVMICLINIMLANWIVIERLQGH